jgi:hypothetical protein
MNEYFVKKKTVVVDELRIEMAGKEKQKMGWWRGSGRKLRGRSA